MNNHQVWDAILEEVKSNNPQEYQQFLQYMLERIQRELGK